MSTKRTTRRQPTQQPPGVASPETPPAAGEDFWNPKTLEELAAEQGVPPPGDGRELLGDFWPEDESADDFLAAVRGPRRMASVVVDTDVVSYLFKNDSQASLYRRQTK